MRGKMQLLDRGASKSTAVAARLGVRTVAVVLITAARMAAAEGDPVDVEELAERVEALEAERDDASRDSRYQGFDALGSEWFQRIRLGGSADAGYFHGRKDSAFHHPNFEIFDARLFLDAALGEEVMLFDRTIVGDLGFSFEWDLVRLADLENDVGDLYVDLRQLAGFSWLSLQVGRFQVPIGEAYLLYGKGYGDRQFVSNVVGGPWWWDEGLRLYGENIEGTLGYVASLTNGESSFNDAVNNDEQVTLKVFGRPSEWLEVSASGLYTGHLGSDGRRGLGGFWLGEAFAKPVGSGTSVPTFDGGQRIAPAPNEIRRTWLVGGDVILTPYDDVRLWIGYAYYDVESTGPSRYDRALHSWVAELILGGGLVHEELEAFYVGFRAHGLGTYDDEEGYLFDRRQDETVGWNAQALNAYSAVLGWRLTSFLTLRAEYTHQDLDFVDGVPRAIRSRGRELDYFAIELGAHF